MDNHFHAWFLNTDIPLCLLGQTAQSVHLQWTYFGINPELDSLSVCFRIPHLERLSSGQGAENLTFTIFVVR